MEIVKAAALGFFICLLSLTLKKNQPALSALLILAGNLVVVSISLRLLWPLTEWLQELSGVLSEESFSCLLKAFGIALIAQLAQDLCKDAGSLSLASSVELCGRLLIVLAAQPLLKNILATLSGWLI